MRRPAAGQVREDAAATVAALRSLGLRLALLSGDRSESAMALGLSIGAPSNKTVIIMFAIF